MKSNKRSRLSKIIAPVSIAVVLLCAGTLGVIFRQEIQDTIEGFSYTPTQEMAQIGSDLQLTPAAVRIFHATNPTIADAELFNASCQRKEVSSPIVGCYTSHDAIFIYDVSNEKLRGIKQVTAAHELLHAVWARMSAGERERMGALLQEVYSNRADEDLKRRMAYYERAQKGHEVNELHSILGTELGDLGDELEAHYAAYFDRPSVLKLYSGYHEQYKTLEARTQTLQKELDGLAQSITARSDAYERSVNDIEASVGAFNGRARSGDFSSQTQFTRERAQLVARVTALETERTAINADIERYNELYAEYRGTLGELRTLNSSVDSFKTLRPPSSVDSE